MSSDVADPAPRARINWRRPMIFCLIAYVLLCLGCAAYQRRMIYFPPVFTVDQTEELGASEGLQRWRSASGEPFGWKRLSPSQPAHGQVLILHGNAGTAVGCGHYAAVIQKASPLDVFIAEYPGYADCPGAPCEKTLYAAAEQGLASLSNQCPIYVVGESLGTGVAAHLAGKYPERVAGLVMLAPYPSLVAVGQAHMPFLPVTLLLRDRFPAEKNLRQYHGPVAVLVAGRDTVVPAKFGRRLYDNYAGPKKLWEFPEGDHGTIILQPPEVWAQILDFVGKPPVKAATNQTAAVVSR